MAPLEPWQRVWIDATNYPLDTHAQINCTACHGGQSVEDMETAHTDMVASPATDAVATCGKCHPDSTPANMNSLHSTLRGYDTILYDRSTPENHATLETMQANHCNDCHTTCGDCHISQPDSVGGGLLKGHTFVQTPPMSQTCTACHGSRVKNEYFGLNEGIPSDVHFRARMACSNCHTSNEIHGVGMDMATVGVRYDGAQGPTCESCHETQIGVGSGIEQHEVHGKELLSCQTCHSTTYTNCTNCHVEQTDDQQPFYTIEEHSMGFVIGQNPLQNAERPYRYVPVRHVPIDVNSFSFYGDNLLPNFDSRPTWVYTTPHNIQRNTPQTESCLSCHENDAVFLTLDKVVPEEQAANAGVVVESAPALPEGFENHITGEEAAPAATESSGGEDFWGAGEAAETPATSGGEDFWGDSTETTPAPASGEDFWGGDSTDATPAPSGDDAFWGAPEPEPAESTPSGDDAFWGS